MKSKNFSFQNHSGIHLSAKLNTPDDGKVLGYAIFAHCFTCHKNIKSITHIAKAMTDKGFAVLLFDFTGLGESDGNFSETGLMSNVSDIIAAAQYLENHYQAPRLLIGHSFGGVATILAATQIESIQSVVTIASPATTFHVQHLFEEKLDEINDKGKAAVTIGGRTVCVGKELITEIQEERVGKALKTLNKPILIFHSPEDEVVGIDNAQLLYQTAKHPKSFISLSGADHLLSHSNDAKYVGEMISSWATRYIS